MCLILSLILSDWPAPKASSEGLETSQGTIDGYVHSWNDQAQPVPYPLPAPTAPLCPILPAGSVWSAGLPTVGGLWSAGWGVLLLGSFRVAGRVRPGRTRGRGARGLGRRANLRALRAAGPPVSAALHGDVLRRRDWRGCPALKASRDH